MAPTVAVDGGLQLGLTASGAALLGQSSAKEILDLPIAPDDGIGLDPIDHLIEALGGVLVHRQSGDELRSTAGAAHNHRGGSCVVEQDLLAELLHGHASGLQ